MPLVNVVHVAGQPVALSKLPVCSNSQFMFFLISVIRDNKLQFVEGGLLKLDKNTFHAQFTQQLRYCDIFLYVLLNY